MRDDAVLRHALPLGRGLALASVQHNSSGFSIKMSEEKACTGTHYTATVYNQPTLVRLAARVTLQGRVGAQKLGVVGNAISLLLKVSSCMPKIMKIGSLIKKIIAKMKRV